MINEKQEQLSKAYVDQTKSKHLAHSNRCLNLEKEFDLSMDF